MRTAPLWSWLRGEKHGGHGGVGRAGAAKDQHTLSHQLRLPAPSPEQHPAAKTPPFRVQRI